MLTEQEFNQAAQRYLDMVYRIALNCLRRPADAEDAAQEALVRLWRTETVFPAEEDLRYWLALETADGAPGERPPARAPWGGES